VCLTFKKNILLALLFFAVVNVFTQTKDTLQTLGQSKDTLQKDTLQIKKHSPKKATILSAVLPGAGQFYNRKYWKMPVIYAGFGTLAYFINANQTRYTDFRQALKFRTDNDSTTVDNFPLYSAEGLLQAKNYYRRNVELSCIFTVILYTLNVVDAAVDAHLYDFDIGDELSLKIQPALINNPFAYSNYAKGLKLTLKFKN